MPHSAEHKKIYSKVYQRALAILRDKYIEEFDTPLPSGMGRMSRYKGVKCYLGF